MTESQWTGHASVGDRAAIYIRVSTRHQAQDGFSLEDQRSRLTGHAEQQGWPYEVFEDAGISGEKLEERDGLQRLLADVDSGRFQIVLVVDDSRLAREELVGALIRDRLKKAGVRLATPHGERDLSDPSDNFVANVLAAASSFENDLRAAKTRRGLRAAAEAGYWTGGPAPYGYQLEPAGAHTRLAINDPEAEMIRHLVSLVVDHGCSTHEAAKRLNALGYSPRRSEVFNHRITRRILEAETLGGSWTYGESSGRSSKFGTSITMEVPRIITTERHDQLQRALKLTGGVPHSAHRTYPLTGHLFGDCGERYYGQFRKDRHQRQMLCYGRSADTPNVEDRCSDRRYLAGDLEIVIWETVVELLSQPERLLAMVRDYLGLRTEQVQVERDQLTTIQSKVKELDTALTQRAKDALKTGLPSNILEAAVSELVAERDALVRHRDQLLAWEERNRTESHRMAQMWDLAEVARTRLVDMDLDEQKRVNGLLQLRITFVEHATRSTPATIAIEGALHQRLLEPEGLETLASRGDKQDPELPSAGSLPFVAQAAVQ